MWHAHIKKICDEVEVECLDTQNGALMIQGFAMDPGVTHPLLVREGADGSLQGGITFPPLPVKDAPGLCDALQRLVGEGVSICYEPTEKQFHVSKNIRGEEFRQDFGYLVAVCDVLWLILPAAVNGWDENLIFLACKGVDEDTTFH